MRGRLLSRFLQTGLYVLAAILAVAMGAAPLRAQAALMLEEPFGVHGVLMPMGHIGIYFGRICADAPLKLRRCQAGELGAVIARYGGVGDYNWIAVPLLPYLYSVTDAAEVPDHADREAVMKMRDHYRETLLRALGQEPVSGDRPAADWAQMMGVAYDRRSFAFRFETTPEADDALIARLNGDANRTQYHLISSNCADFVRDVLNGYFPHAFRRHAFPDAGGTTPRNRSRANWSATATSTLAFN